MSKIVLNNCSITARNGVALNVSGDNTVYNIGNESENDQSAEASAKYNIKEVWLKNIDVISGNIQVTNVNLNITNVGVIDSTGENGIIFITKPEDKYKYTLTINGPLDVKGTTSLKAEYSNINIRKVSATNNFYFDTCMGYIESTTIGGNCTVLNSNLVLNTITVQDLTINDSKIEINTSDITGTLSADASTININKSTINIIDSNNAVLFTNNTTINSTIDALNSSALRFASSTATGATTVNGNSTIEFLASDSGNIDVTAGYTGIYGGTFTSGITGNVGVLFVATGGGGTADSLAGTAMWTTGGSMAIKANSYTQEIATDYQTTVYGSRTDSTTGEYTIESLNNSIIIQAPSGTVQLIGGSSTFDITGGSSSLTADTINITGNTVTYNATTVTI